jgi:hypothetical protein
MSSSVDRWRSPAWGFQAKADALYDLLDGSVLPPPAGNLTVPGNLEVAVDAEVVGDLEVGGTLDVTGATAFDGQVTLGNALADTTIVNSRIATSTVAGAALNVTSAYDKGEGVELRYSVSDWTNIPTKDYDLGVETEVFAGMYLRAEAAADDADGGIIGLESFAVANAVGVQKVEGIRSWAYLKGDTTETINYAFGVRGEVSMDASRSNSVTLTEAAPLFGRVTSGKVADYTKFHGVSLWLGDMDGGSRTYGNALNVLDGPESGTSVLSNLIYTNLAAGALLKVSASGKGSVVVAAGWNNSVVAANPDGYLVVDVGGTPYYVPAYATQPATV